VGVGAADDGSAMLPTCGQGSKSATLARAFGDASASGACRAALVVLTTVDE
jgi:hypothetical protein